jgi:hypothetical protein
VTLAHVQQSVAICYRLCHSRFHLGNVVSFWLPQLPNPVHVLRFRSQGTRIELSNFGSKSQFGKGGSLRLNITAMSMAFGLLWGVCILIVAAANLIWPSYG